MIDGLGLNEPQKFIGTISTEIDNNQDAGDKEFIVREQDRFMPIAKVIRLMWKSIPPHAKISDDAKELVQESVSEFITFVTSEAYFRCQKEHRKTVTAEDVLWAMSSLGFDDYIVLENGKFEAYFKYVLDGISGN
ncbi:Nuclear transcription factor Y subunit B-6-like protein [Heracleum sosnowskyi]|uniref:Nuclear transcription factor Y subunit B-6-like protein n=1 Tax=Heracleum sosnowskyi TaxID=360622 RepID=A0AAD8IBF2_9APIA|nr:Nuclear transcription factor Y subunit B-6-like protein [Heracleum sosnowskyi]